MRPRTFAPLRPALLTLAALVLLWLPMWLTFPTIEESVFTSGTRAEVEEAVAELQDYPFKGFIGARHAQISFDKWLDEAFPSEDTRRRRTPKRQAEIEAESRGYMVKGYARQRQALTRLLASAAGGWLLGWLWILLSIVLMKKWLRIRENQRRGVLTGRIKPPHAAIALVGIVILGLPILVVGEALAGALSLPLLAAYVVVVVRKPWRDEAPDAEATGR